MHAYTKFMYSEEQVNFQNWCTLMCIVLGLVLSSSE